MSEQDALKQQAAIHAVDYVASGTVIGLGSGSTMRFVLEELARRLNDSRLREVVGVPTSDATADLARQLGIALTSLDEQPELALVLDGADEIDPQLDLIKGLGGALLREKVVASAAARFVVVADATKLVQQLGSKAPLPVEVIPFARAVVEPQLRALGAEVQLRVNADGVPFITDEGNLICHCRWQLIDDPAGLNAALHAIPGVVEHGLFLGMATTAVVATAGGVQILNR